MRTDNFPWCVPAYLLQGELRGHQRLPKQSPAPCASKRKALCLLSESVLAHARSKHIHTHTQWSRSRPRVAIPSGSAHRGASVCEPGALLPLCNQHVGGGRKLAGISCHHQEHHPGLWTCIRPSLHVFSSLDCESNQTVLQIKTIYHHCTVAGVASWAEYDSHRIQQMAGRAGRPGFDTEGKCLILTQEHHVAKYRDIMNVQVKTSLSLNSQFL